jgi:hypothetical protein
LGRAEDEKECGMVELDELVRAAVFERDASICMCSGVELALSS